MTTTRLRAALALVSLALLFVSMAAWVNLGVMSAGTALVGSLVAWGGSRFVGYREAETWQWDVAFTGRDVGLTMILVAGLGFLFFATRQL